MRNGRLGQSLVFHGWLSCVLHELPFSHCHNGGIEAIAMDCKRSRLLGAVQPGENLLPAEPLFTLYLVELLFTLYCPADTTDRGLASMMHYAVRYYLM